MAKLLMHLVLTIFCAMLFLTGCDNSSSPENKPIDYGSITTIRYSEHVQALFNQKCVSCHGPNRAEAGLRLDSWSNVIKGSSAGEAVIPFDSEHSLLVEMLTKLVGGPHPADQGEEPLSQDAIDFLARWIDEGAKNDAGDVPYAGSTHRLYACSQNASLVDIIDTQALVVIRTVNLQKLGFRADAKPHHVAIDPDGSHWYLSMLGESHVLRFDEQNNLVAQSPEIVLPALLARLSNQPKLFVSRFLDPNNPLTDIYVLNTEDLSPAANTEQGRIPVLFKVPHAIAASHAGDFVYTASLSENQLIIINTQTNEVDEFVDLNPHKGPVALAVSPDDRWLYISCQLSNEVLVVDLQTRQIVAAIPVGQKPWHLAVTPDGSRVYVGNNGSDNASVIDTATRSMVATIEHPGFAQPHGIAITNDGKYVFISNRNTTGRYVPRYNLGDNAKVGTVVVIDTATNQVVKVLEIEPFGSGLGLYEPGA
ncbi:MAG: hypothetical protein D6715_05665 [Calditrichaeota bacterium]|nr:MAG: hypothetical protein D6715_05665 [Calditrichota bacterium]